MAVFSFRAECESDVERFKSAALDAGFDFDCSMERYRLNGVRVPDVRVEVQSRASLSELRSVLREVEDGHVMLETLRQCAMAENSMERDPGVYHSSPRG